MEEREKQEHQVFVLGQKKILLQRSSEQTRLERIEKEPIWQSQEEDLEEQLEQLLSRVQLSHQQHFNRHRFCHPKLVAEIRKQFCGSCGTKLPLKIAGEIATTSNIYICYSCKAFCIA